MFMEIAIGAIGIGIVLMVGYLLLAQVRVAMPSVTASFPNSCYGRNITSTVYCNTTAVRCGPLTDNTNQWVSCVDTDVGAGMDGSQATIFAGLSLVAVGIIVLAAFGLINVFRN